MRIEGLQLLRTNEWLSLAAGLTAAGMLYLFLIHPSLRQHADLELARAGESSAQKQLRQAEQQLDRLRKRIVEREKELEQLGGSPPLVTQRESQIARVTDLAGACGITIDRYAPLGEAEESDHVAFFVQFSARATFASLCQFLHRLENEIDFVDVTHFSTSPISQKGKGECVLSWSCRINGMREVPSSKGSPTPLRPLAPSASHAWKAEGVRGREGEGEGVGREAGVAR